MIQFSKHWLFPFLLLLFRCHNFSPRLRSMLSNWPHLLQSGLSPIQFLHSSLPSKACRACLIWIMLTGPAPRLISLCLHHLNPSYTESNSSPMLYQVQCWTYSFVCTIDSFILLLLSSFSMYWPSLPIERLSFFFCLLNLATWFALPSEM